MNQYIKLSQIEQALKERSSSSQAIDCKHLIKVLATSKAPAKLKVVDTLFVDNVEEFMVQSWVYTNPSGCLTTRPIHRPASQVDILKTFVRQTLGKRSVGVDFLISDVYIVSARRSRGCASQKGLPVLR